MRDFGGQQAEGGEAFAATQAFLDREDLGIEAGILDRGSTERGQRGDEMLVIVGETVGAHGDAHQDTESVVLVAHRHCQQ